MEARLQLLSDEHKQNRGLVKRRKSRFIRNKGDSEREVKTSYLELSQQLIAFDP